MVFDKILRDKVRYLFWYLEKLRRLEFELSLQNSDLDAHRFDFIHLSRTVTTQLIYLIINEEISNAIDRTPLPELYNQLWIGDDNEGINYIFRGNSYYNRYVEDIFVNRFNDNLQAFFFDYQFSMWSAFELSISNIFSEFSDEFYIDYLNQSHFNKLCKLLNKKIIEKLKLDVRQNEILNELVPEVKGDFLKLFPRFISSDDKINYLFKSVINKTYTRDVKKDKMTLHFIRSLRNTAHNNGIHFGNDIEVFIKEEKYELVKGEHGSFGSDLNTIKIYFELLEIYSCILISLPKNAKPNVSGASSP